MIPKCHFYRLCLKIKCLQDIKINAMQEVFPSFLKFISVLSQTH